MIVQTIDEGKRSKEFREDLPVEITAMAILGMVNWTDKWYRESGSKSIDEIGDIFVNLVLHAVLKTETITSKQYEKILIEKPFFTT